MAPKAASKKEVAPAQASSPMRWPIYLLFAIGAALIAVYLSAPPSGISAPGPTFLQKIRPAGMLCERTNSPIFTEDIKKDYNTGVVFLSADQHRGKYNTVMGRWNLTAGEKEKGDLWYYDPWKDVDVRRLLPDGFDLEKNDFHPLGIGLHFYPGNQFYFYVINHRRSGGTVELFTLDYHVDDFNASVPTINWVRTIKSPVVNTPNSILAVPPTGDGKLSFYVTNDHFMHNDTFLGRFKFWENALRLPLASVAFCTIDPNPSADPTAGVSCRLVAKGLRFANGIGWSHDHKTVYVAETLGYKLTSFKRDPETNELSKIGSTAVTFAIDNVEVDESDGSVISAGHPDPKLVPWVAGGVGDPTDKDRYRNGYRAGSRVVRIRPSAEEPEKWKVNTVFEDDGTYFGTTSTGVYDNARGVFIASGLYDIGLLVCRRTPQQEKK